MGGYKASKGDKSDKSGGKGYKASKGDKSGKDQTKFTKPHGYGDYFSKSFKADKGYDRVTRKSTKDYKDSKPDHGYKYEKGSSKDTKKSTKDYKDSKSDHGYK